MHFGLELSVWTLLTNIGGPQWVTNFFIRKYAPLKADKSEGECAFRSIEYPTKTFMKMEFLTQKLRPMELRSPEDKTHRS